MSSQRTKVFIPDDYLVWIHGEIVTNIDGSSFEVEITDKEYLKNGRPALKSISLKANKSIESLPLQNELSETGVEDMITLNYLHEASILDNLRRRFQYKCPYTYTGDICIAVNPYLWLDIYSPELRDKYLYLPKHEMMPHAYATSANAYKGLRDRNRNQSILVSGESGAGKTETVKILMSHLAQVSGKDNDTTIVKVLKANPLLESFGNAKTVRNDNSSRFGKFTQLQFDQHSKLVGSRCVTYLLEKTRVVSQSDEHERNYHVFHEVFAAPEEVKASLFVAGRSCKDFAYTCQGDTRTDTIEGVSDGERYLSTMRTLALLGVREPLQHLIRQIIVGIVLLGQVLFQGDADTSCIDPSTSADTIDHCCALLGLSPAAFKDRVIVRNIEVAGNTMLVALSREQAVDGRDALAKDTYTRLFLWLVSVINESTAASEADASRNRIIGLLDIFGFESFRVNRFEQLCINYTNEKLQQKFTLDVLMSVQAEYRAEGLDWANIEYKDNNDVLDLLESKLGFIALLNEECLLPKGSNSNFLSKITNAFSKNALFSLNVLVSKSEFCIHHYAGKVSYNVNGFLERNKDALPAEMRTLMLTSTNELVSHIFLPMQASFMDTLPSLTPAGFELLDPQQATESISPSNSSRRVSTRSSESSGSPRPQSFMKADTVLTKFKSQLTSLMESISLTDVSYVRCLKPNSNKDKAEFDRLMIVEQLRCAGIIEAVKVSRAAYPYRISHKEFVTRFKCLKPTRWWSGQLCHADQSDSKSVFKLQCQALLQFYSAQYRASDATSQRKQYEIGKTKAFFSDGVLELFERERVLTLAARATQIQRLQKTRRARRRFLQMRACAICVQSFVRCHRQRRQFQHLLASACCVQSHVRRWQAMALLVRMRRAFSATLVQSRFRMVVLRRQFKALVRGFVVLSSIVKRRVQRAKYLRMRDQAREDSKLTNQLELLKQRLVQEQQQRVELEASMLRQKEENAIAVAEAMARQKEAPAPASPAAATVVSVSEKELQLASENEELRRQIEEMKAFKAAMAAAAAAPPTAPATPSPIVTEPTVRTPPAADVSTVLVSPPDSIATINATLLSSPPPASVAGLSVVTPTQPPQQFPEDYERIKAELEAMRKLVDQVTLQNTHQNNHSAPSPIVATPDHKTDPQQQSSAPQQSAKSPNGRTPLHRVSISAPSTGEYLGSPVRHRSQIFTRKASHHGHVLYSGQHIVNARHQSISVHGKSAGAAVVKSPNAVRDIKIVEKLKSTESELAAFKKKIAKLEEANRQLQKRGINGDASVPSPQRQQESVYVGGSDDSDDSEGDQDEDEMVTDLDNRNSDWQAYLGSFHDLCDLAPSSEEISPDTYDPADTLFDENGDEILPPEHQPTRRVSGSSGSSALKAEETVLDDVETQSAEDEDEWDDDDDESQSTKSSGRQFRMARSADKDSDDDSGAEDDQDSAVDRTGLAAAQTLRRARLDSDGFDEDDSVSAPSGRDGGDLGEDLYDMYPDETGDSIPQFAAVADANRDSFSMSDVYEQEAFRRGSATSVTQPARRESASKDDFSSSPERSYSGRHVSEATSTSEVARDILAEVVYSSAQLHEATGRHDTQTMHTILSSYPKMAKSIDVLGQTVLHIACRSGSLTLVQTLLEYNIDVNVADFAGKTALHLCRDPAIITLLCEEGAAVNQQDASGLVPLHEYVSNELVDCVRAILPFGASPAIPEPTNLRSSIHLAADLGNYELLAALTQECIVAVNYDQADVDGFTPLQLAASCDRETGGQLKIFMLLLNRGASAVLSNERGISPLHLICANRNLSQQSLAEPIVELLLGLNADPNAQDVDGCTPLIVACAYREWGLCKLLLEAGGDLNIPCTMNSIFLQGDTRISFSKEKNDIKTVALMEKSDCTASDLMPKGPRHKLFDCISVPQTRIPGETRDRCMNCAATFGGDSSFGSMFRISSGKHHCRHCLRVVCQDCSSNELPRGQMPPFVQSHNAESSMRVCLVCYSVLKERNAAEAGQKQQPTKRGSYWG